MSRFSHGEIGIALHAEACKSIINMQRLRHDSQDALTTFLFASGN
ncbi:hypothetical protein QN360_08940 [Glaciimonas sp. CA11.2]|nr:MULTISPECIES: hypothetical protein [unclassified Glaciimonas]MDY7546608.1 hypothetical protein [Glaciimonas sp. CA11.2]MEB0011734.1 hypothetical protein [Glaciimonas sp. Cout2]MEB0080710.1 hypothetical protein [Glaciimonas sp. Gout2]MEB0163034.1 hypothetical protein [Glaciimonas sp. CA11.2]